MVKGLWCFWGEHLAVQQQPYVESTEAKAVAWLSCEASRGWSRITHPRVSFLSKGNMCCSPLLACVWVHSSGSVPVSQAAAPPAPFIEIGVVFLNFGCFLLIEMLLGPTTLPLLPCPLWMVSYSLASLFSWETLVLSFNGECYWTTSIFMY